MPRNGLTFDEYLELRNPQPPSPTRVLRTLEDAIRSRDGSGPASEWMFPMTKNEASNHLRARGYDCRPETLDMLLEHKVVNPTPDDGWNRHAVEAAAEHLEYCGIFTPYAEMCRTLGGAYSHYLLALSDAADRESKKYGRTIRADESLFIMCVEPPRGEIDDVDGLVGIRPAVFAFTLCADVRERIERGEGV